jgi:amino-acid N-acetyltransferase
MNLTYKLVNTAEAFTAFQSLLKASGLPADDLQYQRDLLIGYYENDELVGTGALEVYGDYALLRSLSVKLGIRGKSVGTTIADYLIEEAEKKKLKAIYLFTEKARGFFLKKGFEDTTREAIPAPLQASSEFTHVCPTSAVVMKRELA